MLHSYLRQEPQTQTQPQLLRELLQAQQRTNRLLQALMYGGVGFVLGLLGLQLYLRFYVF